MSDLLRKSRVRTGARISSPKCCTVNEPRPSSRAFDGSLLPLAEHTHAPGRCNAARAGGPGRMEENLLCSVSLYSSGLKLPSQNVDSRHLDSPNKITILPPQLFLFLCKICHFRNGGNLFKNPIKHWIKKTHLWTIFGPWFTSLQPVAWEGFRLLHQETESLATTWVPGLPPQEENATIVIVGIAQSTTGLSDS